MAGRIPVVAYGGDYNPEQWPEEVWTEDVRLMREAGVNLVSLGIFSWSRLQPAETTFDFGWLDRVIDLLHDGGVAVDLATGTASPPPWLSHRYPESLPMLADGSRLWPGSRQHYCPSSPAYRDATRRLVEALAERYAKHPAVVMWHVGNEYGCHVPACWCDVSAGAFRSWLQRRYRDIEALNRAWGTDFWSQRYAEWVEVLPPRQTPTWPNPSQQLDFQRFCSDELLACYEVERSILRERCPDLPVTTNFMSFFQPLDYWAWAAAEDIVSNDSYPDPADPDSPMRAAMAGDLMRSLGGGRPWMLMEQTPNRVNWRRRNAAKAPGQMRLWSLQAVARGADAVMFFQWRQARAGAEKFHSAMVPHGPVESSPTWAEVVQLGGELARLPALTGTQVRAEVAILFDWENWWALELPSKPTELRLMDEVEALYRVMFDAGVAVDFAHPAGDLSAYRLVLAPHLYLVSDETADRLHTYVAGGGRVVMSYFSGIVDPSEHVRLGGYPAPFRDLLGLTVVDFAPLSESECVEVDFGDGGMGTGEIWSEKIRAHGAEVVARFRGGVLDGEAAVTRHRVGDGVAHYLGTHLDSASLTTLLGDVCRDAGVEATATMPPGVEAVRRSSADHSYLFLLNHRPDAVEVPMPAAASVLIPEPPGGERGLWLGPFDAAVIRER